MSRKQPTVPQQQPPSLEEFNNSEQSAVANNAALANQEGVHCHKCDSVPDHYISLNCQHNFCLVCMAYRFMREGFAGNDANQLAIVCELCNTATELDSASVEAVDFVIKEIIQVNQQKQNVQQQVIDEDEQVGDAYEEALAQNNNDLVTQTPQKASAAVTRIRETKEQILQQAQFTSDLKRNSNDEDDDSEHVQLTENDFLPHEQYQLFAYKGLKPQAYQTLGHANGQQSQKTNRQCPSTSLHDENSDQKQQSSKTRLSTSPPEARNRQTQHFQQPQNNFCLEHPFEELSLFCFSCENRLLCLKCMLDGTHRNHEVKNFVRGVEILKERVAETGHQINANIEILLWNEKRLGERRRNIAEKGDKIRRAIRESMRELHERIENKENELLLQAEQFLDERQSAIDKSLEQMRAKTTTLSHLKDSFNFINQNQKLNSVPTLFRFYGECKGILNQITEDNEEIFTISSPNSSHKKSVMHKDSDNEELQNIIQMNGVMEIIENLNRLRLNFSSLSQAPPQAVLRQHVGNASSSLASAAINFNGNLSTSHKNVHSQSQPSPKGLNQKLSHLNASELFSAKPFTNSLIGAAQQHRHKANPLTVAHHTESKSPRAKHFTAIGHYHNSGNKKARAEARHNHAQWLDEFVVENEFKSVDEAKQSQETVDSSNNNNNNNNNNVNYHSQPTLQKMRDLLSNSYTTQRHSAVDEQKDRSFFAPAAKAQRPLDQLKLSRKHFLIINNLPSTTGSNAANAPQIHKQLHTAPDEEYLQQPVDYLPHQRAKEAIPLSLRDRRYNSHHLDALEISKNRSITTTTNNNTSGLLASLRRQKDLYEKQKNQLFKRLH